MLSQDFPYLKVLGGLDMLFLLTFTYSDLSLLCSGLFNSVRLGLFDCEPILC